MSKQRYALIAFAIIGVLLLFSGVEFYDSVWSFPGNLLDKNFLETFPLASVPLMVVALLGTGVYMTFKLGFPQLKHILHGMRVTRGDYDNVEDEGDDFVGITEALKNEVNPLTGLPKYTPLVALSIMVFYVYAAQCMATFAIVKNETNSWKWPLIMIIYMMGLAYIGSLLVYQGGQMLGFV